jgi:hypothetical protein
MSQEQSAGGLAKGLFKSLLGSKKFAALITGLIANLAVLGASKLGISEEVASGVAMKVTGLVGSYILGQGFSDLGKEKAKVEIDAKNLKNTEV